MKNVIFFVVLAILTVAALVGWNAVRTQSPRPTAQISPTPNQTPVPTQEVGTAVGRGTTSLGNVMGATSSSSFADVTKGNTDPSVPVIPTNTPMITVTRGPSPTNGPTPRPTVQPTPMQITASVINYTEQGFNPKTITIKNGAMVKFVNQTNKRMWIVGADVLGGKKLDGLNMGIDVGKDGTYEFQFSQTGTWGYIDQNNQTMNGTVIVQ